MKNLAIIPARSGSKGLKDKNIRSLCGKPLLAYSVEAALESGIFDEVMVSTDSREYADTAKRYGAKIPFLRSGGNASDTASTWDTVREVLDGYRKLGEVFDAFCLLQPTSPLRTAQDIRNACRLLEERASVAVVSVCEPEHSPLWCGTLNADGGLDGFLRRGMERQRQALESCYRINGAIYFVHAAAFYEDDFLYRKGSYAYVMDADSSIDIDTKRDFLLAETILREREK